MIVKLEEEYQVAEGAVTLCVTVGEAQRGHSIVLLDRVRIDHGATIDRSLGDGSALRGKELLITTVVVDTNVDTNRTSVTYELLGGEADETFVLEYEVPRHNARVGYRARFRLL